MAITRIQEAQGQANAITTLSITLPSTPTNGNVIVLVAGYVGSAGVTISSVSQTGVTWSPAISTVATSGGVTTFEAIWYGIIGSGAGTTITVTFNQVGGTLGIAAEYSGLDTSSVIDKIASNSAGSGTSLDSGTTGTTARANELWIGGFCQAFTVSETFSSPTNGFTIVDQGSFVAGAVATAFLEKIVSTTGTANTGVTSSSGTFPWTGLIATFKAPSTNNNLMLMGIGS